MANNPLEIKIIASLNEQLSTDKINNQLKDISKELDINVGVDMDALNKVVKQVEKIQKQIAKSQPNILNADQEKKNAQAIFTTIDAIKKKFKEDSTITGTFKWSDTKDAQGQITSLTGQVKNALGKVQKIKYAIDSTQMVGDHFNFNKVSESFVDNTQQMINKLSEAKNKINNDLEAISKSGNVTAEQVNKIKIALENVNDTTGLNNVKQTLQELNDKAKLAEQMAQGRERAEVNANNATMKAEQAQANAINKNIEAQAKEQQRQKELNTALQEQIALYQRSANLRLDNIEHRYLPSALDTDYITKTRQAISDLNKIPLDQASSKMKELSVDIKEIGTQAEIAGGHAISMGERFKQAMVGFPVWMAASTLFFQSFHFLEDGIKYVSDMDNALNQIAIVTGKSQDQVNGLARSYHDLANELSVTTLDVANAAVVFARQGLSQSEVMDRLKVTTQYAKISNLDFNKSAELLTATTNSMGVSIQKASDVFSYLGDATSTGADELGIAFQKVGGSAKALNLDFTKTSSWIAEISSRTRESATTVGDSVKSILARIQNLQQNGFDSVDGTKVNDVAKSLSTIGVQLVNSDGQFNNFGKVMDSIGKKWDSLDSRHKAYISTAVAGSYQQSRFMTLMDNYGDSVKLYDKALSSAGTTQQKYNIYLQSTEAHVDKLRNALEGAFQATWNSDGLKAGIDALTNLINVSSQVINSIGAFPSALGLAGVALVAFNSKIREGSLVSLKYFASLLSDIPAILKKDEIAMAGATARTEAFSASTKALSFDLKALKAVGASTMAFLGSAILPVAGFMLLGTAIEKVTGYLMKQHEQQQKVKQEIDNETDTYSKNEGKINSLTKRYKDLSDQIKQGQITPNNKEYLDVQNKLNDLLPSVTEKISKNGQAHLKSASEVAKNVEQLSTLSNVKADKYVKNFDDSLDKINDKLKDMKDLANPVSVKNVGLNWKAPIPNGKDEVETAAEQIVQEREYQAALEDRVNLFKKYTSAYITHIKANDLLTSSDKKYVSSLVDHNKADLKTKDGQKQLKETIKDTAGAFAELRNTLGKDIPTSNIASLADDMKKIDFKKLKDTDAISAIQNLIKSFMSGAITSKQLKDGLENLGISTKVASGMTNDLKNAHNDAAKGADKQKESVVDLTSALKDADKYTQIMQNLLNPDGSPDAVDQANRAVNAYMVLSSMMNDLGGKTKLTKEEQQELSQSYRVLADQFPQYANGHKLNVAGIQSEIKADSILNDAINKSAQGQLTSEEARTLAVASNTKQRLELIKSELKAYRDSAKLFSDLHKELMDQATADTTGMEKFMTPKQQKEYQQAIKTREKFNKQYGSADEAIKEINKLEGTLTSQTNDLASAQDKASKSTDKSSKSTDNATESITAYRYVLNKLGEELDNVNSRLQILSDLQSRYDQSSSKYRSNIGQEIKLLKQKNDILKTQADSLDKQIESGNIIKYGVQSNEYTLDTSGSGSSSNSVSKSGIGNYGANVNRWIPTIEKAAENMGVSLSTSMMNTILKRIKQESGGNQTIVNNWDSNAKAGHPSKGLLQFIQSTFDKYKVSGHGNINSGYDQLLAMFNNTNWEKDVSRSGGWGPSGSKRTSTAGNKGSNTSITIGQEEAQSQDDIVQAKQQLNDIRQQIIQNENAIQEAYMNIVNSHIAEYDNRIKNLDDDLAKYQYKENILQKGSKAYKDNLEAEKKVYNDKKKIEEQEIKFIQTQINKNKNLNSAQKQSLKEMIIEKQQDLYSLQSSIADVNSQIKQMYQDLADQVVQTYKDALEKQKDAETKAIDDQLDSLQKAHDKKMDMLDDEQKKFTDNINKQIDLIDRQESANTYNSDLSEKQKAVQDIQSQINNYGLDTSIEGQARVADLKKQLEEATKELSDFQHQHEVDMRKQALEDASDAYSANIDAQKEATDKQFQDQQDTLNKQKDAVSQKYEDMINDERNWTNLTEQILKGHLDNISSSFASFSEVFQNESSLLGQSIANNIVDELYQAEVAIAKLQGKKVPAKPKNSTTAFKSPTIKTPAKFDTGGYTGDNLPSSGGLAIVHKKEQIFNEDDTSNLRKIMDTMNDLRKSGTITSFMQNIKDKLGSLDLIQNFQSRVPKLAYPDISPTSQNVDNRKSITIQNVNVNGDKNMADQFYTEIERGFQRGGL